jgi:ribonuclease HI
MKKQQPKESQPHVVIYTDGACLGNPGLGGYGIVLKYKGHRKELSEGFRKTTNNRMELMAAIAALESLNDRCKVTLYTDSQYLVDSLTQGWAQQWREKGWKRNKREKALNPDLWEKLLNLFEQHEVEIKWLRGHAGDVENERADALAGEAAKGNKLKIDHFYEKNYIPLARQHDLKL